MDLLKKIYRNLLKSFIRIHFRRFLQQNEIDKETLIGVSTDNTFGGSILNANLFRLIKKKNKNRGKLISLDLVNVNQSSSALLNENEYLIYEPPKFIKKEFLLNSWKWHTIQVIQDLLEKKLNPSTRYYPPWYFSLSYYLLKLQNPELADASLVLNGGYNDKIDWYSDLLKNNQYLLSSKQISEREKLQKNLGITKKYILVHVRTSVGEGFDPRTNQTPENIIENLDVFLDSGFQVVYCGTESSPQINSQNELINYAHHKSQSLYNTILLASNCEFAVSQSTGWIETIRVFDKPILLIDAFPYIFSTQGFSKCLFTTKKFIDQTGNLKTILDVLDLPIFYGNPREIVKKGWNVVDSRPSEVREAFIEFEKCYSKNNWQKTEAQVWFKDQFREQHGPLRKIGDQVCDHHAKWLKARSTESPTSP